MKDSKKDVERVGRLMLAARYKINEAPSANAKVNLDKISYSLDVSG